MRGKIDKLHVRSRLGDGMRFSFGKWELSDCIIEAEGVSQGQLRTMFAACALTHARVHGTFIFQCLELIKLLL